MSVDETNEARETRNPTSSKTITRREFLKVVTAVTALGVGGGAAASLVGCGGGATTTSAPTAGATTSATVATTTSVSTGGATTTASQAIATTTASSTAEGGRDVKVGVVAPMTGIMAAFSPSANWQIDCWKEALAGGVVTGDGKSHKIVILLRDSQSDSNRASQVASDLIMSDKVDGMFGCTADTANPAADQCEVAGVPSLTSFDPWQSFFYGRGATPDKPFKWTYALALGMEQMVGGYMDAWDQISTNKKVAGLWPNTADGNAWSDSKSGAPPLLAAAGYELTFPGSYSPGAEDFTAQITAFKNAGCEICMGAPQTAEFSNFWKQALQQGFHPKAVTIGLALLFPEGADAIGDAVLGCTSELVWHPSWPFKSSLTGQTCQQLADDYETRTGAQWSAALAQYSRMEVFVHALKQTNNVDDKEALIKALGSTKLETMWGLVDFTSPVQMGTDHPVLNCFRTPTACGQWVKGTGKWHYEIVSVSSKFAPGTQVQAKALPMQYA